MPLSITPNSQKISTAKDRKFISNTTVAPALAGKPTLAEITTAAGTERDRLVYYTGTDTAADSPTYVYLIDASGVVTLIESSEENSDRLLEKVNQTAHGFTVLKTVYHNGTAWVGAKGDDTATTAQAIVTSVTDADNFEITTYGAVKITGHGLNVGEYYWLDQAASSISPLQPSTGIAQSLLNVRDANNIFVDVGQAINSGLAKTEPLHYGKVSLAVSKSETYLAASYKEVTFDTSEYIEGLALYGNGFKIVSAGRYKVNALLLLNGINLDGQIAILVNGSPRLTQKYDIEVGFNVITYHSDSLILKENDLVALSWRPYENNDDVSLHAGSALSISQEVTSTVVLSQTTSYSLSEQPTTRKWVDGKVIYERVFDVSTSANFDSLLSGIDSLIDQSGIGENGLLKANAPIDTGTDTFMVVNAGGAISMRRKGVYATPVSGEYIIAWYTKA